MDDLTTQLRRLGDAVEADAPPVHMQDIAARTAREEPATDIGLDGPATSRNTRARRKPSRRLVAAAAALLIIVAGSIAFVSGQKDPTPVDLASAVLAGEPFAVPENDNGWLALRDCESMNTYDTDTGNTFFGAYQFTRELFASTAADLGLDKYAGTNPALAPPHIQDAVANAMYLERGDVPWPVCGRYIEGPMVTPVVPHWLGALQPVPDAVFVFVFIDPGVESDRLRELEGEIRAIVDADIGADSPTAIEFVDKNEAFADFQQTFADADKAFQSVTLAEMPPRFEISRNLSPQELQLVRDLTGVFEVVTPEMATPLVGALRLSIPAIGLEAPVYPTPSLTDLAQGAVAMAESPSGLVVAGYGSTDGSVFARLGELRNGDTIVVTRLVVEAGASWELKRTFRVDLALDAEPVTIDLDDMLLWQRWMGPNLTLVADVAGQPRQRLMVRTQASDPDLSGYPIEPAN